MSEEASKTEDFDLDSIMELHGKRDGAAMKGGALFEREEFTFPMSGETCAPGVFYLNGEPLEFKLTVVGLTHQEELEAGRTVKAATDLPFALAKRSLFAFKGKPLDMKKREWLWEALGPKGRQVVVNAYGEVNAAGDEALGKLQTVLAI